MYMYYMCLNHCTFSRTTPRHVFEARAGEEGNVHGFGTRWTQDRQLRDHPWRRASEQIWHKCWGSASYGKLQWLVGG